jgi:hypothetical protein
LAPGAFVAADARAAACRSNTHPTLAAAIAATFTTIDASSAVIKTPRPRPQRERDVDAADGERPPSICVVPPIES